MIESKEVVAAVVAILIIGIGAFSVFIMWGELQGDLPEDADVTTIQYYNETFQPPDINATNASENWYVYSESGLPWANVTNETAGPLPGASNQTFHMNTTPDTPVTGGVLYDFVNESTYDTFSVYVLVESAAHNHTVITIGSWIDAFGISGHGAIAFWNITNDTISFWVLSLTGPVYTQVWEQAINTGTWYHLYATFDYDSDDICASIYSIDLAGVENLVKTDCETTGVPLVNVTQSFWAIPELIGDANCSIWMDDFQLTDSTTTPVDTIRDNVPDVFGLSESVFTILGLVIIIAALMAIVGMLYKYGKFGK